MSNIRRHPTSPRIGCSNKPGPKHELWTTWYQMMYRCYNPNAPMYKYYGAVGIGVYKPWHCFYTWLAGVGERPKGMSLDRIDNNGHYEPSNVRWATRREQLLNRGKWACVCEPKHQCPARPVRQAVTQRDELTPCVVDHFWQEKINGRNS